MSVVALMVGMTAPAAWGFYVQNHESVTRHALPPDQVDHSALLQIMVGPPPGGGAVGSDAFATDEFRHIDNAANPFDVCVRVTDAWNFFTPIIFGGAQPAGPGGTELVDGPGARAAFGGLAHALQDFYSHTNWVEDNIAIGQPERPGPPLMPVCDPLTLPAGLHSGYFDLDLHSDNPAEGCPVGGPPPPFAECHTVLNKDGPATARGSRKVPGLNMNYYDLAALLATRATTDLFWTVRGLVVSNAITANPGVDGECVAANLFQADRHAPCWP